MKKLMMVALLGLLLAGGCAAPEKRGGYSICLICPEINVQLGGNHTQPDIDVANNLGAGATQAHELPITHDTEAATKVTPGAP